jgi:hypothetical protein
MAQPIKWPDNAAYVDALQDPSACFRDPELKTAVIMTDSFGLPDPATGRSAIVFHATMNSAHYALRFFTRSVPIQRGRYEQLNADLEQRRQPYFVPFCYYEQAILVDGVPYPMVRMEWSEGVPLNEWVATNLQHGADLKGLAATWLGVVRQMQASEIAHGDLSNDNCLVRTASDVTLIDYDSCFIPALARENPGEDGNPNFQHPQRSGYYAANMDAFPALVIYLSLLALSEDKGLWRHNNKENLIFRKEDYLSPGKTAVWQELDRIRDPVVTQLTGVLKTMCRTPIAQLRPPGELADDGEDWWNTWDEGSVTPSPVILTTAAALPLAPARMPATTPRRRVRNAAVTITLLAFVVLVVLALVLAHVPSL